MSEKRYIVYLIEIPNDPRPYVGITSEKSARIRMQKCYPHNPALQEAISRAGGVDHIKITELERELFKDEASRKEAYYCELYNSLIPNGYNQQPGGLSGYHQTQEAKDKNAAAHAKPVAQIDDKSNSIVAFYISRAEAERITGINNSNICANITGRRKHAGCYTWKPADHILEPEEIKLIFDHNSPNEITL